MTTVGHYTTYSGNAKRIVGDIDNVPGCVGEYPLKWTRTSESQRGHHGKESGPSFDDENFSGPDMAIVDRSGKPANLVTPSRIMKKYDPKWRGSFRDRVSEIERIKDTNKKTETEKPKRKDGAGGATVKENANNRPGESEDENAPPPTPLWSLGWAPLGYSPAQGAEATNYNGQFQPDFAWHGSNADSPFPTGPVHSAWYGNHSWGW